MSTEALPPHRIHRHPASPWATLRQSVGTRDCYRPHAHAEYSIGIVDQGCAVFEHPGGHEPVGPGTVVLIEPGLRHACNPQPGAAWSYRMLFIEADWLHQALATVWRLLAAPPGLHFPLRRLDNAGLSQQLDRLCQQLCQPQASEAAAQALAHRLPIWLAPLARPGPPHAAPLVPDALRPAWQQLQRPPEAGPTLTVDALARACGMSSPQFIRRFRAVWGMTPGRYLQNLRLNGARRLLAQGLPLAEVAQTMGFADQAHLQRMFKAHHAMTPGAYRPVAAPGARA